MNVLGFAIETNEVWSCDAVVPLIDGIPLTERIDTFEKRAGMKPAGGMYGGLTEFDLGNHRFAPGKAVSVLGCTCGVADCWPLDADITVDGDTIVWDGFRQHYREDRDYTRFGPFRFDRAQYEAVVSKISVDVRG